MIYSFGNKEFLLKEFSKTPSKIKLLFNEAFTSRLPFLFLTMLGAVILYPQSSHLAFMILLLSGYVCNAFSTLVIYNKNFSTAILIELLAFSVFVSLIWISKPSTIVSLFNLFAIQYGLKMALYMLLIKNMGLQLSPLNFSFHYIKKTVPFFLIGLIGFINTKVDLFLIIYFEKNETIALYQIITNFFIMVQSLSVIISLPFTKHIYRLKYDLLLKIENRIRLFAPLFITLCLLFTYFIIVLVYGFNFKALFYAFGFFIIFPSYWLLIRYFVLFKNGKEMLISKISLISVLINFMSSFVLLKLGYGMLGVIAGSALASVATVFMFFLIKKSTYERK
ncbi:hypothetical protein [Aestuariivivens sediminis]|uniref:hypothetical protein n=1 Tax=Aestuariivivens sediminis TaxID=2913557 RepID=UPI001F59E07F|nr:hypothetical protein [Aestuariivivens sediminis]